MMVVKVLTNLGEAVIFSLSKCSFHLISPRSQIVNLISVLLPSIFYLTLHFTNMTV